MDQLAVHFNLKGNLIHVESDEAKYGPTKQLDPVGKILKLYFTSVEPHWNFTKENKCNSFQLLQA